MEWYDKGRMNVQGGGGGSCSTNNSSCAVKTNVCVSYSCFIRF